MSDGKAIPGGKCQRVERAEPSRLLQVLDRQLAVAKIRVQYPTDPPGVGRVRIECQRIHDTGELGQEPIARQLEDPAPMPADLRFEQVPTVGAKTLQGLPLVLLDEAAVADHVGGKDGDEATFHLLPPRAVCTNRLVESCREWTPVGPFGKRSPGRCPSSLHPRPPAVRRAKGQASGS